MLTIALCSYNSIYALQASIADVPLKREFISKTGCDSSAMFD